MPPHVPQDAPPRDGAAVPAPQWFGVPPAQLGMWVFLSTVAMLFAAFLSAYLVRRAAMDWRPVALPALLWWNTGVLAASSATLEAARLSRRKRGFLLATIGLGVLFLAGQLGAWRELVDQGVYLPSSPHSTFFYLLTGLHGLHLLGGLGLLLYALVGVGSGARARRAEGRAEPVMLAATYWHFLGALWLLLFLVLSTL